MDPSPGYFDLCEQTHEQLLETFIEHAIVHLLAMSYVAGQHPYTLAQQTMAGLFDTFAGIRRSTWDELAMHTATRLEQRAHTR